MNISVKLICIEADMHSFFTQTHNATLYTLHWDKLFLFENFPSNIWTVMIALLIDKMNPIFVVVLLTLTKILLP